MKNSFLIFLSALLFVACGSPEVNVARESEIEEEPTAKDIVIEELSSSCQCVEAFDRVLDELIVASESSDSIQKSILTQILKNVEQRCIKNLDISKNEASLCDGFEEIQSKFDVYNSYLKK